MRYPIIWSPISHSCWDIQPKDPLDIKTYLLARLMIRLYERQLILEACESIMRNFNGDKES